MHTTKQHRPIRAGVFATVASADKAVHGLLAAGFTKEHISVVCSDKAKESLFADYEHERPAGTTTATTATVGGVLGGLAGGLVLATGIVATGGIGLFFVGAILAGSGAAVGTFVGAMMSRGLEPELANFYDQALRQGQILVAAEADPAETAKLARAEQVFHDAGAASVKLPEG